ncbi:MAG: hypothetical protein ACYS47_08250 [Planctomycetota bacterium]
MVRFSDILNKISKKHGAKPTSPKPLDENELSRSYLGDKVQIDKGPAGLNIGEPTEELSRGVMERLFKSVLDTPPEAPTLPRTDATVPPRASKAAAPKARGKKPAPPDGVRGFRNHAELMKFASLLINDVEDALKAPAP